MSPDQPPVNVNVNQTEPGFTITLREVWDELRKVSSKLDTIHDLPADVRELQSTVKTIEANYVSKSSVRWWFTALVALIGAISVVLGLVIQR